MGTMNVGKVSFGNAQPAAGTAQGAKNAAPVKKADKGDVVVIGGKEIRKSTLAKGGVIATAVAALGTLALAASRGKGLNEAKAAIEKANGGAEGEATKFIQNVKDGFKTFFGKGKDAYKTTLEKAKGLGDKTKETVAETVTEQGVAVTEGAADKGTAVKEGVDKNSAAEPAKQPEVKKAANETKQALKSEELEKKLVGLTENRLDLELRAGELTLEQAILEKRANDLPGVIQKHKDNIEGLKIQLEDEKLAGAGKKTKKAIKAEIEAEKTALADAETAQKEVANRKKAVDGQIKSLTSEKAVENAKKAEDAANNIEKRIIEMKKAEFLENSEELKTLNEKLEHYKNRRAELTGTDTDTIRKQGQYDSLIEKQEDKIKQYKEKAEALVEAKAEADSAELAINIFKKKINEIEASTTMRKDLKKEVVDGIKQVMQETELEKKAATQLYQEADIALYQFVNPPKTTPKKH